MEIEHHRWLPDDPNTVWAALNDPAVLAACMPGCESVERIDARHFRAVLVARVGPAKARFHGEVRIVDPQPPTHYTLAFQGSGRALGRAEGRATVRIEAEGGGSRLHYRTVVNVGGRLARFGGRLIDATALRLTDRFFDRFAERPRR